VGYYVHLNKQNSGPFSEEEIGEKYRAGEIKADTLVAKEGDADGPSFENRSDTGEDSSED